MADRFFLLLSGLVAGWGSTLLYFKTTGPSPSEFPPGSCSQQSVECEQVLGGRFWVYPDGKVECNRSVNLYRDAKGRP